MRPTYYKNRNNDDVVERDGKDARLEALPNWEVLSGDAAKAAAEDARRDPEAIVFSQVGEVSEDGNHHGAGTKHSELGYNATVDAKGHSAANVPDETISDGSEARSKELEAGAEAPTEKNTAEEIEAYAAAKGIDLGGAKNKAEKLALITKFIEGSQANL